MRPWLRALLVFCVWAGVGCSSDGGAASLLGATCNTSDDCEPIIGVCITSGKGGMCVVECDRPGQPNQCPLDSYCDRSSFTSDKQPMSEMIVCLPACKAKADCRDGYECTGVSSGEGKVCKPK